MTAFTRNLAAALILTIAGCGGGGNVQPLSDISYDIPDAVDTSLDSTPPDLPYDTTGTCTPGSCPPGQECVDGMCRTPCAGGSCSGTQVCCSGYCVNTNTDPYHCGACDASCWPEGNFCLSGSCSCNGAAECPATELCCSSGGCVMALWDRENCGGCGVTCGPTQQCIGGTCGGSCADHGCPEVAHGTAGCDGTICIITSCEEGWADGDGIFENGCECAATADDLGGADCASAHDLGTLPDTGSSVSVEGFVSASAPQDWYSFTATDSADTDCDTFHVDVRFDSNPGDVVVFDAYLIDCASEAVCEDDIEFVVATDFFDDTGAEPTGECPCSDTPVEGQNMCSDNSAIYYVMVEFAEGMTTMGCEPYMLTVRNGP